MLERKKTETDEMETKVLSSQVLAMKQVGFGGGTWRHQSLG